MKRLLLYTTILLTMFSMVSMEASAHDFEVNGIFYKITSSTEKTVDVTYMGNDYTSRAYSGSVVIPESITYGGVTYSVTGIGYCAFYYCSGLTSVTIPNSVTSIGGSALQSCRSLTSVTIPNSVTVIGNFAFDGCSGLTSPVYSSTLFAYLPTSFNGNYTIPEGIKIIGNTAFYNCSGLTSVVIPNSVTTIGALAFESCRSLTSMEIPNSVMTIGDAAFECCSGLISVEIPTSVTNIGHYAFRGCSGLTSVVIPNNVTTIKDATFLECTGLTSITIPNSVTSIGRSAFKDCSSLTFITIPNSVTSIGNWAFYNCNNLFSVNSLIEKPFDIETKVFSMQDAQTETSFFDSNKTLYVPKGTKALYEACEGWKEFSNIVETDNIQTMAGIQYKLYGNEATVTYKYKYGGGYDGDIVIPATIEHNGKTYYVTCIGDSAFYNCTGLNSISIPNSVASIGRNAFYNTAWFDNQPDGVVYAGKVAYAYKGTMPKGTELVLKEGTLGIASYAFSGCHNMASFTIPNSVKCLGNHSFISCTGLTSAFIPKNVTTIGIAPFDRCEGLENIVVEEGNPKYDSRNNCNAVIEKETGTLLSGCKNTIIPNDISTIGEAAFSQCNGLSTITIPDNITAIKPFAFVSCENLTSIVLPPNLKAIDRQTFQLCTSLESIDIPDNVESIGLRAFLDFKKLAKIKIGTGLRSCGEYAFSNCESIASITIDNNYLVSMDYTVDSKLCDMFGSMYFAMAKEYTIGEHVTSIGERAFQTCNVMETLTLPSSLTEIKRWAFNGCSKLRNVIARMDNPFDLSETYPVFSSKTYSDGTLYVPVGTKELYQSKSGWRKFANIVEIGTTDVKGVTGNNANATIKEVYTLDGHEMIAPQRGLNILRMGDGTVRKVVIK